MVGRDSSVDIVTGYGLDCPGFKFRWEDENCRTSPDRPCGPTSDLYDGYRVPFPGVKKLGRGVDHPPPPRDEVFLWDFMACPRVNLVNDRHTCITDEIKKRRDINP